MEPPTQGNDKAQQRRPEYKYIDTYIYIYIWQYIEQQQYSWGCFQHISRPTPAAL
jgi:hypothetical protein